jgi:hypothetical protein
MIGDISKAVSIFRTSPNWGEVEIYNELVNEGVDQQRAARLVEFLPIVYCRLILRNSGARFSNMFRRRIAGGGFEEMPFVSDPVWNEAVAFAFAETDRGVSGRDLLAVAARSAEFDAANQLLNTGSKLEDITFTPPILNWPEGGPVTA